MPSAVSVSQPGHAAARSLGRTCSSYAQSTLETADTGDAQYTTGGRESRPPAEGRRVTGEVLELNSAGFGEATSGGIAPLGWCRISRAHSCIRASWVEYCGAHQCGDASARRAGPLVQAFLHKESYSRPP